jgi:carboxylesterase type B
MAVVEAYAKAFPDKKPVEIGLPTWPRYTSAKGETMILDDVCEVRNDPDREARKAPSAL